MQKPNQPVLTNAGRQMLNDVAGSKGKITYTKAVMYGQDLSSMTIDQLRDLTTINDSKLETKIGVSDIKLETVTIIASFSNATVMQDTTYSAIGWYASTTVDSTEKLIAVIPYQQPQTLIAGSNGKATASTDIQLLIRIGDDVNVELKPIEEGLISEAELKNALTLLSSKGLLYLGDEITDSTYQADANCFDKISNTSIKRINLKDTPPYKVFISKGWWKDRIKQGWILTLNDPDNDHFSQIIIDDENNKVAIRTSKNGFWTQFLNKDNLLDFLPSYLTFDNSNILAGLINWNNTSFNNLDLRIRPFLKAISYNENDPSIYETIETGLYDKLLINHAQLMTELAPYGKVKSVNGTQPDEDGNVTLDIKGDIDKEIDDKRPTSLKFGTVENGQTFITTNYPDNEFQLSKYNKALYLDPVSFIDSLTYKDKMSDNLLVSHAQLIKALSEKVSKEDLNNAPFVKTASSTPVTLNPGVTPTGKTLIYKSPTGNPTDDVYLATENDLNQKADKSSIYSKSETYSKDEATKTFGKTKTVNQVTPDANGNIQLNAQNIPNAVFGTSRSRKQLEINPSVTIGSDRKGYMIRDGSETFDLASSDDFQRMQCIETTQDIMDYGLNQLSTGTAQSGIYYSNLVNIQDWINISELKGNMSWILKISTSYNSLQPTRKNCYGQLQELLCFTADETMTVYRRLVNVLGGSVLTAGWYKFTGTKVD